MAYSNLSTIDMNNLQVEIYVCLYFVVVLLTDYVPIGPRFSNLVLQALLVLMKKVPPHVSI
jgi:hypothetical protein